MKKKIVSRSLFLLLQRYEKAKSVPDCLGFHMWNVMWSDDVREFLTEHKDELDVKLNKDGLAIKKDEYYFKEAK